LNAAMPETSLDATFVNCDNEGGMELAVSHLWELGHRKIAFLYEVEETNTPDCISRRDGYIRAIHFRGGDPSLIQSSWHLDQVTTQIQESGCSAIVCWTERAADRLLSRLAEAGVSVPEQMSVVGFDSTLFCETTTPRLTAVRQPIREMAAHAAQTLLELITGQATGQISTIFPCTLDVRGSTAICLSAEE